MTGERLAASLVGHRASPRYSKGREVGTRIQGSPAVPEGVRVSPLILWKRLSVSPLPSFTKSSLIPKVSMSASSVASVSLLFRSSRLTCWYLHSSDESVLGPADVAKTGSGSPV